MIQKNTKTKAARNRAAAQAAFLGALAAGATIKHAAKAAGVGTSTIYRWRDADAAFRAGWDGAMVSNLTALECEAARRALEGVKKPVYRGGEVVGHVTEYSDTMLMFLLKRHGERGGDGASIHDQVKGARETLLQKFAGAAAGA